MLRLLSVAVVACAAIPLFSATFGTPTGPAGGASYTDIVLDEPRTQIYLVNSANSKIDIYNYKNKAFATSVPLGSNSQPLGAALGWPVNGTSRYLYVTAYASSTLYQIDLTAKNGPAVSARFSLPYNPEGVGVGADGRVLVTTIGCAVGTSGCATGTTTNTLFLYDPNATTTANLVSIPLPVPPPTSTSTPTVPGRAFLTYHGALMPTPDGKYLIGVNGVNGTTRLIFVYETASATVLRSREVTNLSNVVSVSPDNSRFMAGSVMFDINTLQVIAQENVSNSPFAFPSGNASNFNTASNQGGSVFTPDGTALYAAFNISPVQNPPAKANVTQLLVNDPNNLLIQMGIQLPENMAGKMVIDKAGANIYAISDSGFTTLPISAISSSPLASVNSQLVFLANDQCGVTANLGKSANNVTNTGKGRITVSVQSYTLPGQGTTGLGGFGGPGGGGVVGGIGGVGIVVILPGGGPGGPGGGFTPPGGGG